MRFFDSMATRLTRNIVNESSSSDPWDDEFPDGPVNSKGRPLREYGEDEEEKYHDTVKKHLPEAAKAIMHKLKIEHPDNFDPKIARKAIQRAFGAVTGEDCEEWMIKQDFSHTPVQKEDEVRYSMAHPLSQAGK